MKKSTRDKIDLYLVRIFCTSILFLFFAEFWVVLEQLIYGHETPRLVDEIISIPILFSFYYNVKTFLEKHNINKM